MEDHVGWLLSASAALLAALASFAALLRALDTDAASESWAALAAGLGLLAALLALGARRESPPLRAAALAAGLVGLGVAGVLLAQTAWLVARSFSSGAPSRALGRPAR